MDMGSTLGSAFSSKKKLGVQKCVSESGATSPGRRRPAPMDNGGDVTKNLLFFLCCKWLCKHTGRICKVRIAVPPTIR